jgi:flagellin-specific chaperone FliS
MVLIIDPAPSSAELVIGLYDQLLDDVQGAWESRGLNARLTHGREVVAQLLGLLDSDLDTDGPHQLSTVHRYIDERLALAQARRDPSALLGVAAHVERLRRSWSLALATRCASA